MKLLSSLAQIPLTIDGDHSGFLVKALVTVSEN